MACERLTVALGSSELARQFWDHCVVKLRAYWGEDPDAYSFPAQRGSTAGKVKAAAAVCRHATALRALLTSDMQFDLVIRFVPPGPDGFVEMRNESGAGCRYPVGEWRKHELGVLHDLPDVLARVSAMSRRLAQTSRARAGRRKAHPVEAQALGRFRNWFQAAQVPISTAAKGPFMVAAAIAFEALGLDAAGRGVAEYMPERRGRKRSGKQAGD